MLTADLQPAAEHEALVRGAQDFVTKPFRKEQIRLRVGNLLRTRYLHLQLREHAGRLEELEIRRQRGRWFAPHVVDAFLALVAGRPELVTDLDDIVVGAVVREDGDGEPPPEPPGPD